jgi:uncharacterized protein
MYLVGAAHPHKADARRLLEAALSGGEKLVTDAEVLQEILHRYVAIDRRDAIQPAFDAVLGIVDEVLAVTEAGRQARQGDRPWPAAALGQGGHSCGRDGPGRDRARHVFRSGFDSIPGLVRLHR